MFERNLEVHRIVEYLFAKNLQLLAVTGPATIGKNAIITKAIVFAIPRHPNVLLSRASKVDLMGITVLGEVIV